MASTLCTVTFSTSSSSSSSSSSSTIKSTTMYSLSPCSCSLSSATNSCLKFPLSSSKFPQLGFCHFSPWSGLKHLGVSISPKPLKIGKVAKYRGNVVYASLFGVGAPEALVIGVVALLVFGPKGLAEVARNLGKTLRTFQPTIRELQDVSREFKSTLEREIGLDDVPGQTKNTYESNKTNLTSNVPISSTKLSQTETMPDPNGAPTNKAYSSEDYLKITEEQLKAQQEIMSATTESQVEPEKNQPQALQQDVMSSSPESQIVPESPIQAAQQDVVSPPSENVIEPESQPQAVAQEAVTAASSVQKSES